MSERPVRGMTQRNAVREASKRWKPFAPVAELAFDSPGEIFTTGFVEGALWAAGLREETK